MTLLIDWGNYLIPERDVLQIKTLDLEDFYAAASDLDKANLYFVLLCSFYHYMSKGRRETAARLSFLLACYLFMCFCPPASGELAAHYIEQAVSLHPTGQYKEWQKLIQRGN